MKMKKICRMAVLPLLVGMVGLLTLPAFAAGRNDEVSRARLHTADLTNCMNTATISEISDVQAHCPNDDNCLNGYNRDECYEHNNHEQCVNSGYSYGHGNHHGHGGYHHGHGDCYE